MGRRRIAVGYHTAAPVHPHMYPGGHHLRKPPVLPLRCSRARGGGEQSGAAAQL